MEESPRDLRVSSILRGCFIGGVAAVYGWAFKLPQASPAYWLLVSAGLQVIVIVLRRVVPPDVQPRVMYVFELIVDGATVLAFALGVFGAILRRGMDV